MPSSNFLNAICPISILSLNMYAWYIAPSVITNSELNILFTMEFQFIVPRMIASIIALNISTMQHLKNKPTKLAIVMKAIFDPPKSQGI